MATLTKTWNFTTNLDGWTATPSSPATLAWTSADAGSITGGVTGRNSGGTNNLSLTISTTYGALGIPSGASITAIQFNVDHKCTTWNVGAYLYFSGLVDSVTQITQVDYTAPTTLANASSASISVTKTDTDTVALELLGSARTGNNASASVDLMWDDAELIITYEEASYDFSGVFTSSSVSSITTVQNKSTSSAATVEATTTDLVLNSGKSVNSAVAVESTTTSNVAVGTKSATTTVPEQSTTTSNILTYTKTESENFDRSGIFAASSVSSIAATDRKNASSTIALSTTTSNTLTYSLVVSNDKTGIFTASSVGTVSATKTKYVSTSFSISTTTNARVTPETPVGPRVRTVYSVSTRKLWKGSSELSNAPRIWMGNRRDV